MLTTLKTIVTTVTMIMMATKTMTTTTIQTTVNYYSYTNQSAICLHSCFVFPGLALLSALLILPAVMGWLGRIAYLPLQAVCCIDWGWSAAYSLFIMFTCALGPISTMSYCYFKILQTVKHSNTKIRSTYAIQMSTVSKPKHEECSRYGSGKTPGISRNLRRKPDHAATTSVNIESITNEQPYEDCSKNGLGKPREFPKICDVNLVTRLPRASTSNRSTRNNHTTMNILEMDLGKPRDFPKFAT